MSKNPKTMTETPIEICGKSLYFKRCPNSVIKVYDEKIRDKAKSIEPIQREIENKEDMIEMLEKRLANNQKRVDFISMKEYPSDEELDEADELLKKQEGIFEQLMEAKKEANDFAEENREVFENIDDEMKALLGEKVEAMLEGITKEEFLENNDVVDIRIATNLSKYYELCIIGERPKKIQEEIKKDSRAYNDVDSFQR